MYMSESEQRELCPFHWQFSLFLLLGNNISSDEFLILILNNCILKNVKSKDLDYHLPFVGKQYRIKRMMSKALLLKYKNFRTEKALKRSYEV